MLSADHFKWLHQFIVRSFSWNLVLKINTISKRRLTLLRASPYKFWFAAQAKHLFNNLPKASWDDGKIVTFISYLCPSIMSKQVGLLPSYDIIWVNPTRYIIWFQILSINILPILILIILKRQVGHKKCDQIWRNIGILAKSSKSWAIFWGHISNLGKIWTDFGKFYMQLGKLSMMQMAKCWKNNVAIWSHWSLVRNPALWKIWDHWLYWRPCLILPHANSKIKADSHELHLTHAAAQR